MSGFIVMGEDAERFLEERGRDLREDFQKNAAKFGLDPQKGYDFICLSFEPGQCILPAIQRSLEEWPAGPVRGYVNHIGNLCVNMPMSPGEDAPEEEDIFKIMHKHRQEYYDLESANWECYRVEFPLGTDSIAGLIERWNEDNETA